MHSEFVPASSPFTCGNPTNPTCQRGCDVAEICSGVIAATTELDVLEPFSDWAHPIIDWDSNVGIRLASFVSVNYIFRLVDDRDRSDRLQTEHRVLLRFSWQIL